MAGFTNKFRLAFAVGFFTVTTARTGSTGVARVNCDYKDAFNLSFIFDKASQFVKAPFAKSFSLRLRNRYSETFEVFQTDGLLSAFSDRDDLFAYLVISVAFEAAFSAGKFLQMSLGVL